MATALSLRVHCRAKAHPRSASSESGGSQLIATQLPSPPRRCVSASHRARGSASPRSRGALQVDAAERSLSSDAQSANSVDGRCSRDSCSASAASVASGRPEGCSDEGKVVQPHADSLQNAAAPSRPQSSPCKRDRLSRLAGPPVSFTTITLVLFWSNLIPRLLDIKIESH